jgi:hypothetical protein
VPAVSWLIVSAAIAAAVEVHADMQPGGLWLDENGLMLYEPHPAKVMTISGQQLEMKQALYS